MAVIIHQNTSLRERYEWNASRCVWTGNAKVPITSFSIRLEDGQGITLQKIIRIAALCIFAFAIDLVCMAWDLLRNRVNPVQSAAPPVASAPASSQALVPTDRRQILRNGRFFRERVSSAVFTHIVAFLTFSEQTATFRLKRTEAIDAQAIALNRISPDHVSTFLQAGRKIPSHRITRLDLSGMQFQTATSLRKYCSFFNRVTHLSIPSACKESMSRAFHVTLHSGNPAAWIVSNDEISEIVTSLLQKHQNTLEEVTFGENEGSTGPTPQAVLKILAESPNLRGLASLNSSGEVSEAAWIALAQKRKFTRFTWESYSGLLSNPSYLSEAVWNEILQNPLEELRLQNTDLPDEWVRDFSQYLGPQLRVLDGCFDLTPDDLLGLSEGYPELQVIRLNYKRKDMVGLFLMQINQLGLQVDALAAGSTLNANYRRAVTQIMHRCTKLIEFEFSEIVNGPEVFELVRQSKSLTTVGMYLRDEADLYGLHLLGNLKRPLSVNAILSGKMVNSGEELLKKYRNHEFIRLTLIAR